MTEYLDPEEFPFSIDEVLEAAALWATRAESVALADQLRISATDNRERRGVEIVREATRRKELPTTAREPMRICEFTQFDWLWPTLSVLPESSMRARAWMQFHWQFRYSMLVAAARRRAGERAGTFKNHDLTPERSRELRETGEIHEFREFTRENFILPVATVENVVEAYDGLRNEQAAWEAIAVEARRRYEKRIHE